MAHAYISTRFDVTDQVPSLAGPLSIAAWVFAPPALPAARSPVVLVCLPGSSYTKAYYHLEVPGYPEAYSFALHMLKQGFIVVALDHLGVGESTWVPDGSELTTEVITRANAAVASQVRTRLAEGTLVAGMPPQAEAFLVGVGHSMGSFLLITQQADHRSFDAIAPLGNTNKELSPAEDGPDPLLDLIAKIYPSVEQGYMQPKRPIAHALFHAADVPASVIEADDTLATHVPVGIMVAFTDSRYMLTKAARIDVPVFLGNGDLDVSADFRAEAATYLLVRDITLFHLAGSAHCHNFASTRTLLWDRLARWIEEITSRS